MKRVKVNFNFKSMALVLFALVLSSNVCGETVTYTIKSTSSVTTSGTAPTGSSASFSTTYTDKNQLTSGKSHTFTLSGFDGCTITGLKVNCKTNASSGAGSYTLTINGSQKGTLSISKIGSSYTDKTMTVTSTKVNSGTNVTFVGNCTANSLYTNSITITYTPAATAKYSVTFYTASGVSQTITEASAGAGVTPPSMEQTCGDYTFAGWSKTQRTTEVTTATTVETLTGGKYYPEAATTLYPIYTRTEGGGTGFTLSVESEGTTYYVAPKTGSNKYFGYTTTAADALTIYAENNQYLYYYDSSTKTYFSNNSNATDITFSTSTPSYTWTMTEEGGTITFKTSATGGRNFAYNKSSPRFAAYTGGNNYPYEFTKHAEGTTYYHSYPSCGPTCTTSPSVSTGAISGATTSSLTFNCSGGITSLGSTGCEITEYGYVYGTSENPTTSNTKHKVGESYTTTGTAFAAYTATELNCGTTYYMRPYAINGNGPAYGAQVSLTTLDCPVDHFIDNIQETSGYTGDGKAVSTSYTKASITLSDKAAATTGSCETVHYHFVGWVTAENRAAGNVDAEHIVNFQNSGNVPTGTTYYAVWAAEQ